MLVSIETVEPWSRRGAMEDKMVEQVMNNSGDQLTKRRAAAFERVKEKAHANGYVQHWKNGQFCTEKERNEIRFRKMINRRASCIINDRTDFRTT